MRAHPSIRTGRAAFAAFAATVVAATILTPVTTHAETQLFWGDTHLHTKYSADAFLNGNLDAGPDEAYRFAKGEPVIHPLHRARVQLERPLDFLVVSDHAIGLGAMYSVYNEVNYDDAGFTTSVFRKFASWYLRRTIRRGTAAQEFNDALPHAGQLTGDPVANPGNHMVEDVDLLGDVSDISKTVWADIVETADRHYQPGKFTSLVGWEWTSMPMGSNLHRVVMSPMNSGQAKQFLPYSSVQSQYPKDLWNWLDKTGKQVGSDFVAIPHNSNLSKGYMFAETTLMGEKISSSHARLRARFEPVVEITQIKGDGETWPTLSPDDPYADFEAYTHYLQSGTPVPFVAHKGDFIRPALKSGLKIDQDVGVNPYKFGVIGSTDSHTALATGDEDNFHGKMALDSIPENKFKVEALAVSGWEMSAAGYAAVWAKENTREEIFAAFKRRETYATTGPRIALRVFGGFDLDDDLADDEMMAQKGYASGVPMGGDLVGTDDRSEQRPVQLAIRATKDPLNANLDQVHVVKGWVDAQGHTHEKVFPVVWSDDRPTTANGYPTPVGNTVNLQTGATINAIGASELTANWTDPEFDPTVRAFYYVRVLQIPTIRHSKLDTLALNIKADADAGPETLQERAYSSPIWYTP